MPTQPNNYDGEDEHNATEAWKEQRKNSGHNKKNFELTSTPEKRNPGAASERPICSWCQKAFGAMEISGNRAAFDLDNGILIVKYEQALCICKTCITKSRTENIDENKIVISYQPEWIASQDYDVSALLARDKQFEAAKDYDLEFRGDPNDMLDANFRKIAKDPRYKKITNNNKKIDFLKNKLMGR